MKRNQYQFRNWKLEVVLAVLAVALAVMACNLPFGQKQETAPPVDYNSAQQPTPMPYGIGLLTVTERLDLDPLIDGNQTGVSINFTLSVQDPKVIQYQYFEISNFGAPVFVLSGYETPIGDVKIADFVSPQVSFTKNGKTYVCPPVDPSDPFVIDCRGVLSQLLSN